MSFQNEKSFTIHIIGEVTGETFAGEFTAYKFLSSRLAFRKDQLLRSYLAGENPMISGQVDGATKMAVVQTCLASSPDWWKESGYGLELLDLNVVDEVYKQIQDIQEEALKTVQKRAAKAAPELPELAAKDEQKK